MILDSKWSVDIPDQVLPTWLFGNPEDQLPHKPQFIDPEQPESRYITIDRYRWWARRIAAGLMRQGLKPGDRVLVVAGNLLSFPGVFMGILMAGGVFVSANPAKPQDVIAYQTRLVEPKVIISSSAVLETLLRAAASAGVPPQNVYELDEYGLFEDNCSETTHQPHWTSLLGTPEDGEHLDWRKSCYDPRAVAAMAFTSGSTGMPKAVKITHSNLVANSTHFIHLMQQDPEEVTKRPSMKWVGWLPLFGVFGMTQFMLTGPKRQIPNYLMKGWDLDLLLKYTQRFKPTELFLAPAMVLMMAHHPDIRSYDLGSIRSVPIGGAPLSKAHYNLLLSLLPHRPLAISNGFGITEATCLVFYWHPLDTGFSTSCGELMPNCRGKVISLDGQSTILGEGEGGEVCIGGPLITQGYWKQPDKTAEAFTTDGWLKTGDYGYYDSSGKWYITERIKELIHGRNDEKIIPSDIEAALYGMSGVVDAGVIGTSKNGSTKLTVPRAFVVVKSGANVSQRQLKSTLDEQFGQACSFDDDIIFVEKLPKLPNGKNDRDALRRLLA